MATFRADVLIAVICLTTAPALAQLSPPVPRKSVKVERIAGPADDVGLFGVAPDGVVSIDWSAVEATARAPHSSDYPTALMMLAIRDGTWKPAPPPRQ